MTRPALLCVKTDFLLKEREPDRYLGHVVHGGVLDKSAEATVKERAGSIKGAALEVKAIIEDFKMQAISGMMAGERALIQGCPGIFFFFTLKFGELICAGDI